MAVFTQEQQRVLNNILKRELLKEQKWEEARILFRAETEDCYKWLLRALQHEAPIDLIRIILSKIPNIKGRGEPALSLAVQCNHTRTVEALLQAGIRPHLKSLGYAWAMSLEKCRLFLDHPKLDLKGALELCMLDRGPVDCIGVLLDRGVKYDRSKILNFVAECRPDYPLVCRLLQEGAKPDMVFGFQTILQKARDGSQWTKTRESVYRVLLQASYMLPLVMGRKQSGPPVNRVPRDLVRCVLLPYLV